MAFMGSATEALAAAVVADLFFLHERGWWMGVYMIFLANGGAIGSIMSGFVITGVGWRWLFWVLPLRIWLTLARINCFRYYSNGDFLFLS
jgi:MFS family permease